MAPSVTKSSPLDSSRPVVLPNIPELFDSNYLDVLIPPSPNHDLDNASPLSTNNLMEALRSNPAPTWTSNGARAFSSTMDPILDAFNALTPGFYGSTLGVLLHRSWKADPDLTLRVIWNLRSIHDGLGDKELFYNAFGWLYDNHPRTAISNLHNLVTPVCTSRKKEAGKSHGYWKDLLNILALATCDELSGVEGPATFLHSPRSPYTYRRNRTIKVGTLDSRIKDNEIATQRAKKEATDRRREKEAANFKRLLEKLEHPKYRALYITVARLFANQLVEDLQVLNKIDALPAGQDRLPLIKELSLVAKWAPTPRRSHDRVTNISTAISEIIYASQSLAASCYPAALNGALPAHDRAVILRSFYQRWILTQLRRAAGYPEPLMSAGKWKQIKYNRVSSQAMKNNASHFFKHDEEGFEAYLVAVEENKKSISGATLLPHKLVSQAVVSDSRRTGKKDANKKKDVELRRKIRRIQDRVLEAQWRTLLSNVREAGTVENSLAICDVSGSMGSIWDPITARYTPPILPAVSLSLILASVAKPPFSGGFITFSGNPRFEHVNLSQPLSDQVSCMSHAEWGMNTNLQAVFVDLLLPLAVRNNVAPEDMVKRLFIFSDMQFDECRGSNDTLWETNYDTIAAAYAEAGYEMPQIVYWNLDESWEKTVEVEGTRKGVAMMNGFSPAMLKVFMGEQEDKKEPGGEEDMDWESIDENGESMTIIEGNRADDDKDEFTPSKVMRKALMRASYDGLIVFD